MDSRNCYCTSLVKIFQIDYTINRIVGDVQAGWEAPIGISFEDFGQLLPKSFLIALIGFIEVWFLTYVATVDLRLIFICEQAISVGKTFAIQHNYDLGANEGEYLL